MSKNTKGQPPKPVIAIPSQPVKKAGGKELEFPSVLAAARYFEMHPQSIGRVLVHGTKHRPTCGYFFDYAVIEK